jgi:hypothetical protein
MTVNKKGRPKPSPFTSILLLPPFLAVAARVGLRRPWVPMLVYFVPLSLALLTLL